MRGGTQGLASLVAFIFSPPPSRQLGLDFDLGAPPRVVGALLLQEKISIMRPSLATSRLLEKPVKNKHLWRMCCLWSA